MRRTFYQIKSALFLLGLYVRHLILIIIQPESRDESLALIGHHLARILESLGGVYVKFGQLLSTRPDILAEPICQALIRLLDDAPPEEFQISKQTICFQLKISKLEERFVNFDVHPLAAASFATVYRAVDLQGLAVVVKVQRAKIAETAKRDFRTLKMLSTFIDLTGVLYRFRLRYFVQQFIEWTHDELDYTHEAQQLELMRNLNKKDGKIIIPKPYWENSTSKVLVMDLIEGTWASRLSIAKEKNAHLRVQLANVLFDTFFRNVFEDGIFHCDPHMGNVCLMSDGRIGLIDVGMLGFLSESARSAQLRLLAAIEMNDIDEAFRAIQFVLDIPPDAQLLKFRERFEKNIRDWQLRRLEPFVAAEKISPARLLIENFQAARESGISFTTTSVRYYRALLVLDSTLRRIDPEFNMPISIRENYRALKESRLSVELSAILAGQGIYKIIDALAWLNSKRPGQLMRSIQTSIDSPPELLDLTFRKSMSTASDLLSIAAFGTFAVSTFLLLLSAIQSFTGSAQFFEVLNNYLLFHDLSAAKTGVSGFFLAGAFAWLSRTIWIHAYRPTSY